MWPLLPKKCDCVNTGTSSSETNVCNHCGLTTKDLVYTGSPGVCTDIMPGDSVSTILEKISYFLCSGEFAEHFLEEISNNPSEYPDFITLINSSVSCDTINDCGGIPTTTTTSTTIVYDCDMNGVATEV